MYNGTKSYMKEHSYTWNIWSNIQAQSALLHTQKEARTIIPKVVDKKKNIKSLDSSADRYKNDLCCTRLQINNQYDCLEFAGLHTVSSEDFRSLSFS